MEDYQIMLKGAMKKIPKKVVSGDRFKLPEVIYEIQGNKTLVKNFSEIIAVLRRNANHFSKYLFKELATPGTVQNDLLILNAKVPEVTLKKKIEDYTREFVYCKVCGEPDTKLVKEDRITFMVCEACGTKTPVRII